MDNPHFNANSRRIGDTGDQLQEKHASIHDFGRRLGTNLPSKSPFSKLGNAPPFGHNMYPDRRELGMINSSQPYHYENRRALDYGKDYSQQPRYMSPFSGLAQGTATKEPFAQSNLKQAFSGTRERMRSNFSKNIDNIKLSQDTELKEERESLSDSVMLTLDTKDIDNSPPSQVRNIRESLRTSTSDAESTVDNTGDHDSPLVRAHPAMRHSSSHDGISGNTALSHVEDEQQNDLSALMFRGATDLRNVEAALAEQVRMHLTICSYTEYILS